MAEKKVVFRDKSLTYEGIFDLKGLFRTITKWCEDQGYDQFESKNFEEVFESDKKIFTELIPYKKVTDYHKFEIRIMLVCESLKEVDVELNGMKYKMLRGQVNIVFDATLITDYENKWENSAKLFFFRTIIDKFIYKSSGREYEGELKKQVQMLEDEIKAYLNMFRFRA